MSRPCGGGQRGGGRAARSVWLREGPGRRGASGLGEALLHLLLNLCPTGVGHMLSNLCPTGVSNVPCFVVVSPLVVAPHGGARARGTSLRLPSPCLEMSTALADLAPALGKLRAFTPDRPRGSSVAASCKLWGDLNGHGQDQSPSDTELVSPAWCAVKKQKKPTIY